MGGIFSRYGNLLRNTDSREEFEKMKFWTELNPPFSSSQMILRRRRHSNMDNTNEMFTVRSRFRSVCECSRVDISHLIYPTLVSPVIQCSLPFYIHKQRRPCPIFIGRNNWCKLCVPRMIRLRRISYPALACIMQQSITPVTRIGRPDLDEGEEGGGSGADGPSRSPSGTRLLWSNLDGRKDYPGLIRAIEDGNGTQEQIRQDDGVYYRRE